jgi:hypothetical protein
MSAQVAVQIGTASQDASDIAHTISSISAAARETTGPPR